MEFLTGRSATIAVRRRQAQLHFSDLIARECRRSNPPSSVRE